MFYDAAFMFYSVRHLIHEVVASTCRLVCSIVLFNFVLFSADPPGPFAVNDNKELVVNAQLDREESECYRLLLVCNIQSETTIIKVETTLNVFVNDEDDNAPYVNGTDSADIVISYNRMKVIVYRCGVG